jgi:hypothetical protein
VKQLLIGHGHPLFHSAFLPRLSKTGLAELVDRRGFGQDQRVQRRRRADHAEVFR